MRITPLLLLTSLLATACAVDNVDGAKAPVDDDFAALQGMDEKADAFSANMKIVGSLDTDQTTAPVASTKTPTYRAFKFGASAGDKVDVWVRSTDGGDAVAWVLDNSFNILGSNDDASSSTLDSHVNVTMPASTASVTHYVVFRDYYSASKHFTVQYKKTLAAPVVNTSCQLDSDCTAVLVGSCCHNGSKTAINVDSIAAYNTVNTCTTAHPICPLALILETRVAQCNNTSHQCEMVQPQDIQCGGFIRNTHQCTDGFHCQVNRLPDLPGTCVKNACVQNVLCTTTSHWDSTACSCVPNTCVQTQLCVTTAHWDSAQCRCVAN